MAICRITGPPELSGLARLRFITNAFTRMRYCFPNGQLDMYSKASPENAPAPLKPWFAIPGPVSEAYSIAFGHWASLEGKGTPEGIYALDTGCCWGGELTCLRWEDKQYFCAAVKPPDGYGRRRSGQRLIGFMPDGATLIRPTSGDIWLKSRPDKAFRRHPALQR
ncbi:diadenosine tetraphosphatase [Salmonella enterica subsp. enterica]|uniref:Diadenosine tetraphosphatase n=1 Tax=Salmonella enterica I TaxID=59201 RepID=A0A3S5DM18_SALET|nr:diadenosine tetraphosphatase [Salmonella enterica subsp. enterica]